MKLLKLILENREFKASLESELNRNFSKYRPGLYMGEYSKDRSDDDPLKGKGFGSVEFRYKGDLPSEMFDKAISIVEKLGGEITKKRNQYDDDPGDRPYYPVIKFNFSL